MEDINIPIVEERNPDGQISKIERLPASPWWLDAELVTVILLVFLGIGTFSLLTSSYQVMPFQIPSVHKKFTVFAFSVNYYNY